MFSHKLTRFIAAGTAAVAVAIGGIAIGNASTGGGASGAANVAQAAAPARSAPAQTAQSGTIPKNWKPGDGTLITGAAANKVKALALAKYPGTTVNRVLQLSDGSYVAHMFATSGPHHVFVSKAFKVTGTA